MRNNNNTARSFYTLSKAHHPDHHPHDPHAPRRFMRISEAYSVLGHADKKAAYDRDVMRRGHHHHGQGHHGHHGPHHRGSYHSTSGPAGARPASGLSRRRGTFTGPPPSFYRSGGWGSQAAKRRATHEDSTGGGGGAETSSSSMGGMGPGQDPFGHREDVPHFDKEAHERTHRRADERRARRMAGMDSEIQPEAGMAGSFLAICGVLLTSVLVPFTLLGGWRSTKADGDDKKRSTKR
ncbi:uncharacterized protein E0L32_007132 [Thyridium curvatum]|uniref:J domain-containing protein n=1 Tax=Thyridium curvatum TaxID=1093900 RepID=A0A507AZL2_9PEZI|nr:uncharacterized protein E0L32_007132 [Thyridium curvatum]TPX12246.1 hypothetical protein E0L32_007132 [Thyridium curvatum]